MTAWWWQPRGGRGSFARLRARRGTPGPAGTAAPSAIPSRMEPISGTRPGVRRDGFAFRSARQNHGNHVPGPRAPCAVQRPGLVTLRTLHDAVPYTNLPIFKLKESCVRRRYSDFEWLKNELERDSKIVVPPLPGKALKRQLPFRGDEGIFEESFIEERRQGLEQFINKIAGHPLAQNERCLHMFLQEETIDRNYVPGKVRQ
ncbi:sorting nexin-12 isoform X1 [Hirundo rustica]|uniref:sorting nexin-12 isoform X1 n=1 Tax=Hirundo rustica TaxID=43150 RepID=UPI001A945BB2|nr:sorting nexin-12 isoform X1 [Hirundo rustica]